MSREFKEYMSKLNPYMDINNSAWFKDLAEKAVKNSERFQNRIHIYFGNAEDALECTGKCYQRNISHIQGYMHCLYDNTYRVDILMNWKERRPSKMRRKEVQFLN